MSFIHTWKIQAAETPANAVSATPTEVGSTQYLLDTSVVGSSTNTLVAASFAQSTLQSFFLVADQNCTIKTNSSGSPANTWNLIANRPFGWRASEGYFTNPLAANVSAFYVTTGASTTRIQAKVLNT